MGERKRWKEIIKVLKNSATRKRNPNGQRRREKQNDTRKKLSLKKQIKCVLIFITRQQNNLKSNIPCFIWHSLGNPIFWTTRRRRRSRRSKRDRMIVWICIVWTSICYFKTKYNKFIKCLSGLSLLLTGHSSSKRLYIVHRTHIVLLPPFKSNLSLFVWHD